MAPLADSWFNDTHALREKNRKESQSLCFPTKCRLKNSCSAGRFSECVETSQPATNLLIAHTCAQPSSMPDEPLQILLPYLQCPGRETLTGAEVQVLPFGCACTGAICSDAWLHGSQVSCPLCFWRQSRFIPCLYCSRMYCMKREFLEWKVCSFLCNSLGKAGATSHMPEGWGNPMA